MSVTTLDRTAFTALVDDSGSGTDGSVFSKAVLQDIYDKVDALYAAAAHCQVYNNTTQSHGTSGSWIALTFNAEDHDDYGMHSTVSNTSRLTIPTGMGGVYLVGAACSFAANATGLRGLRILKNGATVIGTGALSEGFSLDGLGPNLYCAALVSLAAADYVEAFAYQSSTAALNTGNASFREDQNQFFAVRKL